MGRWPVEDLYYGLAERFVERLVFTDPKGLNALKGQSVLYLANHQVDRVAPFPFDPALEVLHHYLSQGRAS